MTSALRPRARVTAAPLCVPAIAALACALCLPRQVHADGYAERTASGLQRSLQELGRRGIAIVPTPKQIEFGKADLLIAARKNGGAAAVIVGGDACPVAATLIRSRLHELAPVLTVSQQTLSDWLTAPSGDVAVLLLPPAAEGAGDYRPGDLPARAQGYTIRTLQRVKTRVYALAGADADGVRYAAVTFAAVLTGTPDTMVIPHLAVTDWPDVLYRSCNALEYYFRRRFQYGDTADTSEARQFLDRMLAQKINWLMGPRPRSGHPPQGIEDAEMAAWIHEVNSYAAARGIKVYHHGSCAVGYEALHGDDPAYKDCVELGGRYFTWGNDELLERKVHEQLRLIDEMGYSGILLHTIDTRNAKWDDRSEFERQLFGDDRMRADAHMIKRFYALKQARPDIKLMIVPRPYTGNVARPEILVARHELRQPDDLERFSAMVPEDVYLCWREVNRDSAEAWHALFRQPLFLYQGTGGRFFTNGQPLRPYFHQTRTYLEPLGPDMFFYACGWPQSDLSSLGAAEYSWNLYAPGSTQYEVSDSYTGPTAEDRLSRRRRWDPFPTETSQPELQAFVRRACNALYGADAGPHFVSLYISHIDRYFVLNHKQTLHALRDQDLDKDEIRGHMRRMLEESEQAIRDLETLKAARVPNLSAYARQAMNHFLGWLYPIRAGARPLALAMDAEAAAAAGALDQARDTLTAARHALEDETARLTTLWTSLSRSPGFYRWPAHPPALNNVGNVLAMLGVRIESRFELARAAERPAPAVPAPPAEQPEIRTPHIALYDPRPAKGLVFGADGLTRVLESMLGVDLSRITDLDLDTLTTYDAVVIPDCKSAGQHAVNINDLRQYVSAGGGVYLEHDSCGFHRSAFGMSVFPEVAEIAERVGRTPDHPDYQAEDRQLRVIAKHAVTEGFLINTPYEHLYYDHFRLKPGRRGTALVKDTTGAAVLVAGTVGRGRVFMSGCITYHHENREIAAPLGGPEGALLRHAVRWLAGEGGIVLELKEAHKTEQTFPDGIYAVMTLKPAIRLAGPLPRAVLTARCRHAGNLRLLEDPQTLLEFAELGPAWEAAEAFTVRVPSTRIVQLELALTSAKKQIVRRWLLKTGR